MGVKSVEHLSVQTRGGKAFQTKGTTYTKTQKQKSAWSPGPARSELRLQQRTGQSQK